MASSGDRFAALVETALWYWPPTVAPLGNVVGSSEPSSVVARTESFVICVPVMVSALIDAPLMSPASAAPTPQSEIITVSPESTSGAETLGWLHRHTVRRSEAWVVNRPQAHFIGKAARSTSRFACRVVNSSRALGETYRDVAL